MQLPRLAGYRTLEGSNSPGERRLDLVSIRHRHLVKHFGFTFAERLRKQMPRSRLRDRPDPGSPALAPLD